eukprot:gene10684-2783_t
MEERVASLVESKNKGKITKDVLEKEIQEVLTSLEQTNEHAQRAQVEFLKGRVLSLKEPLDPRCEIRLTKSVKLDPKKIDAWNLLGEVLWRKGDVFESKRCFEAALERKENAESLRNLSMIVRQQPFQTKADRLRQIESSIKLAKQALALDYSCGRSWFVMGNAYLTHFFTFSRQNTTLQQALKAFNRALLDKEEADYHSDLHHNRGVLLKYTEAYWDAMVALRKAIELDPCLTAANDLLQAIINQVTTVHQAITRKGSLKSKRVHQFTAQLKERNADGKYYSLCEIHSSLSDKKKLLVKVTNVLTREPIPQYVLFQNMGANFQLVTTTYLFNARDNILHAGDVVVIEKPVLSRVEINDDPDVGNISYLSIRVENPTLLQRNGQYLSLFNPH